MEGIVGPERPGGQGLDSNQEESGSRAIIALFTHEPAAAQTDFVATCRGGVYEVWARRGMVRFVRRHAPSGGYEYEVVEQVGANPIEAQDYRAISTIEDELAASAASGYSGEDLERCFIAPEQTTYPFAYERISQLFDSPNAPDLVVNPTAFTFGRQAGQHGGLDVVQARSPLVLSGKGVRAGVHETAARQVDVAPTICEAMGFPLVDGCDITGRTSTERGSPPDVYLLRQDGRVLDEALDGQKAERVHIFLLDGLSNSELLSRLERDADDLPNLRRLVAQGALFRYGSVTNFPSITWPSHNTIGTGVWCGHHDVVNPTYYLRERRETVTPQGQEFDTEKFLGARCETLYEAFHRALGPWLDESGAERPDGALTAAVNEPCNRGADHATLERRLVGSRDLLKALTAEGDPDALPLWGEIGDQAAARECWIDNRSQGQAVALYLDESHAPPRLVFQELTLTDGVGHDYGPHHEHLRAALDETDRRIGRVLAAIAARGLLEGTLFVITTDHGMARQDTEQAANPAAEVITSGMSAVVTEPCIYLLDLDVELVVHPDGRTARVTVLENDPDEGGERPPVAGARLSLCHGDGARVLGSVETDAWGVAGLALPVHLRAEELFLRVEAEGFNTRHLRLDGSSLAPDPRQVLYGA